MFLVELIKKIIKKEKYNSYTYIKYMREKGVNIGNNCKIYAPNKTEIDISNPWMLNIGNNVKIATGSKILTHDFSWCVTSGIDGEIVGNIGKVTIGNNVFIGMGAIITKGVNIGHNVIIGAGSVVTHDCEPNSVYAGVPAKKIMTIEEYQNKRKNTQVEEAKELAITYYKSTQKIPTKKIMREYNFLFEKRENIEDEYVQKNLIDSGHYEMCKERFINSSPRFNGFEEFLEFCGLNKE